MAAETINLNGRVAIVTGAAGIMGIGRAIALALADAGADVAVCDLYAEKVGNFDLEGTANEIRKLGRRSIAVQTDITSESDVNNLVERVVKELGSIDILVNNAGIGPPAPLFQVTLKHWNKIIGVNLTGCFLCCQAVGKVMVKQKRGVILNISSAAAERGSPPQIPYGMSKAGIISLGRAVAQELAPYGIRVNTITPGPVKTDLNTNSIGGGTQSPQMLAEIREQLSKGMEMLIPMGRLGNANDIASVALFLCSDLSGYMTGEVINVDGGLMLGNFPTFGKEVPK